MQTGSTQDTSSLNQNNKLVEHSLLLQASVFASSPSSLSLRACRVHSSIVSQSIKLELSLIVAGGTIDKQRQNKDDPSAHIVVVLRCHFPGRFAFAKSTTIESNRPLLIKFLVTVIMLTPQLFDSSAKSEMDALTQSFLFGCA